MNTVGSNDPCSPFFHGTVFIPCDEKPIGTAHWNGGWVVTLDKKSAEDIRQDLQMNRVATFQSFDAFMTSVESKALRSLEETIPNRSCMEAKPPREINLYLNLKTQEVGIRYKF